MWWAITLLPLVSVRKVFVSSPFDNFRMECPKKTAAIDVAIRMVESVGAKRQDIVLDMSCENIDELFPWVNIPAGISEVEREDCYYSHMFDPIIDEKTEFSCYRREYMAGITRLTDTRVQIMCCRLRSRDESNCREIFFNKPIGPSKSTIVRYENQLINAIRLDGEYYIVRFCDLTPRDIVSIYDDVKTTASRRYHTTTPGLPKPHSKIKKVGKLGPTNKPLQSSRTSSLAPLLKLGIPSSSTSSSTATTTSLLIDFPTGGLYSAPETDKITPTGTESSTTEYARSDGEEELVMNEGSPGRTPQVPDTTIGDILRDNQVKSPEPTRKNWQEERQIDKSKEAQNSDNEENEESDFSENTRTLPVASTMSKVITNTVTAATFESSNRKRAEQGLQAATKWMNTNTPTRSSVEDISMVSDLSQLTFHSEEFPKSNENKLAASTKFFSTKISETELPLKMEVSGDNFLFLHPIHSEEHRHSPIQTHRPYVGIPSEEDEMNGTHSSWATTTVESSEPRKLYHLDHLDSR
ncbi:hypothetical protein RB195_022165 [Necator americanus]|uniref:Uncharacterized protein n=1 Tax=Necator americanus TaxID=51031 RepID=A0ABR1EE63_NECAM